MQPAVPGKTKSPASAVLSSAGQPIATMHTEEAKTFSQWMRHIASEHEAQIKADIEAAARRERQARIRRICYSVLTVILMTVAYRHRTEIGRGIYALTLEKLQQGQPGEAVPDADEQRSFKRNARANFGSNMKAVQNVAAERDKLLEEFSGK